MAVLRRLLAASLAAACVLGAADDAAPPMPWAEALAALERADPAALGAALRSPWPAVRVRAAELLAGSPSGLALVLDAAAAEQAAVRATAVAALAAGTAELPPDLVLRLIGDGDPAVRAAAAPIAARQRPQSLVDLALDRSLLVGAAALRAACAHHRGGGLPPAARAVAAKGREEQLALLLDACADAGLPAAELAPAWAAEVVAAGDPARRAGALEALARAAPGQAATTALALLGQHRNLLPAEMAAAACDVLGLVGATAPDVPSRAGDLLPPILREHGWWGARVAAAWAILRLGLPDGVPLVGAALGDGRGAEAEALRLLLCGATGVAFADAAAAKAWWLGGGKRQPRRALPAAFAGEDVRLFDASGLSRNLVYLLDVSGSMSDLRPGGLSKRLGAGAELRRSLLSLSADARFAIVCFSDRAYPWVPGTLRASFRVRAACIDRLAMTGAIGGTNTWAAIETALNLPGATAAFLLSDGEPSTGDLVDAQRIVAAAAGLNAVRRPPLAIHTVAFHPGGEGAAARRFLADLAHATGGTAAEGR